MNVRELRDVLELIPDAFDYFEVRVWPDGADAQLDIEAIVMPGAPVLATKLQVPDAALDLLVD